MTTALNLVADAFQRTGVYSPGEAVSATDNARGLSLLNQMMDAWSNMSLACFAILEQSAPLVPGQSAYTIGPGGDFNMTRPIRILTDPGTAYVQDSNGNNYPMSVVPRDKWNLYSNRSDLITSNFPNVLFYDPQFPLGVINVLPFPNLSYTMFWDSYAQLANFATIEGELSFPPGYEIAIVTNLALLIWPMYLDTPPSQLLVMQSKETLALVKRSNQRENLALYDSEIVSRANVQYNVYTDTAGSTVPVT